MPRTFLERGEYGIAAVQPEDIEAIRQWRNAQMDVLRQSALISREQQERYYADHVWPDMPSREPSQVLVSLRRDGELIGYGGLVHISWQDRRAEVSFLLAPELEEDHAERAAVFSCFLELIKELAFADLQLRRLFTETFERRTRHISTLEGAGFVREGRLRENVLIDGTPSDSIFHGVLAREWSRTDER